MTNGKPDATDLQIINILQQDALSSMVTIGKLVYRSPAAVNERIKKLKEGGYIKTYAAIVDRQRIGLPVLVVVQLKLKQQTKELLQAYEQKLSALPQVQCCLHVSGEWDFILHVAAATPQDYYIFLMESICNVQVSKVESSFVMNESKTHGVVMMGEGDVGERKAG